MHYVQTKTPLLTIHTIRDAKSRGETVWTEQTHESMDLSNGGTALGIAVALGEIEMPGDADVMHSRDLYSSVASCSSGVELDRAQIVVVGNARGVGGRYRIGHSVMKDPLDQDGIWSAIRDAGLELPERPHTSDLGGRLVNVFLKCEASQDGTVRGRRNAMLDDSDVHWHRQIKSCVGGVASSVTGDPAVFVSVSAAHQARRVAAPSPPSSTSASSSWSHRERGCVAATGPLRTLDRRQSLPKPWRGSQVSHVIDPVDAGDSPRTDVEPFGGPGGYDDLVMCDALTLSGLIKSREVSCVDVMTAYLDHIERHNGSVNAIVALRGRDELLAEARERDHQLADGHYLGWMHGFPHAVKDLSAAKGLPFTSGSPIFADRIADADDLFVARIKAAGAIVIGKTNTPEFGLGSQTYNPVWGTTATPYDTSRTAGGSSGGAAAALALRMVPVATAATTWGRCEIRRPSTMLWDFVLPGDASPRQVHRSGAVVGPMGRSVADVAQLLSTMAGPDAGAPLGIGEDPESSRGTSSGTSAERGSHGWATGTGTWRRNPEFSSCASPRSTHSGTSAATSRRRFPITSPKTSGSSF